LYLTVRAPFVFIICIIVKVNWRVAWLQQEEAARRRQEEALERERISYAQVSFPPPPLDPRESNWGTYKALF
jgi:hypothetical protein